MTLTGTLKNPWKEPPGCERGTEDTENSGTADDRAYSIRNLLFQRFWRINQISSHVPADSKGQALQNCPVEVSCRSL